MKPIEILPSAHDVAVAARIRARHPVLSLAFLTHDHTSYYAVAGEHEPATETAITRLIAGLYELDPSRARERVRARIFSDREPTEICRGMVRVAAKRLSVLRTLPDAAAASVTLVEVPRVAFPALAPLPWEFSGNSPQDFLRVACRLSDDVARDDARPRHEQDRPVGALLVSPTGEVLSWSANAGSKNRTQHAELRALRAWCAAHPGERLPEGTTLYASLKPCRMCAGAFWSASSLPLRSRAYYFEDDPGPNARLTLLDADSADRKLAVSRTEERRLQLEEQIKLS